MARLSVVGAKNAGKTTLIERLLPALRGHDLRVNSIKHTAHNHAFDTPGKDSHRHRSAGAEQTLTISSSELALFGKRDTGLLTEIEDLLERRSDLCLVEGDKHSDLPKILLTRALDGIDINKIKNIVATYGSEPTEQALPHFLTDDIDGLAAFIIETWSPATSKERADA